MRRWLSLGDTGAGVSSSSLETREKLEDDALLYCGVSTARKHGGQLLARVEALAVMLIELSAQFDQLPFLLEQRLRHPEGL